MASFSLTDQQLALIESTIENKIFLEGPAGTGKTTTGVGRLLHLLDSRVRARAILVLAPQRTLAAPYYEALRRPTVRAGGQVTISTVGGLAQQAVDLFWPLIAEDAGFGQPDQPPTFLTLETAQYYMARLVRPLFDQGYFETVTIDRNRLYSQIIDNLNKAAVVGFPHTQIGQRLKAAWGGEHSQKRIYDEAQACAARFRDYCLAHNLLDFSLQVEVFVKHLWNHPLCHDYLLTRYTHLIVDNVEEDTPVAHDLLSEWLPHCQSALLIYDQEAGYRRFLGADPQSAYTLKKLCQEEVAFTEASVNSPDLRAFGNQLARSFKRPSEAATGDVRAALAYESHRYHPQMLDWVASEIAGLVHEQDALPGEIVVLAPFLTDALRFSLMNRLERLGVPARSHRPSRALREEPATRCLLTLAAIAHPEWGICPGRFDVAYALMQAIDGMDLVRAQLLAEIVYRVKDNVPTLSSFDQINPDMQERITFVLGGRYEDLRAWLEDYIAGSQAPLPRASPESAPSPVPGATLRQAQDSAFAGVASLATPPGTGAESVFKGYPGDLPEVGRGPVEFDHFLSRLFGEVLSQAGHGFHRGYDAGEVAANLIESVQKFRWVTNVTSPPGLGGTEGRATSSPPGLGGIEGGHGGKPREGKPLGQEYVEMVQDGVVAAQYIRSWQLQPQDAVLLAPAYTFLMSNRPVDYQFWLNAGSRGWWERLYQPLTHPYVLSRHWPPNEVWSDADEFETRQDALYRLTLGLIRRCRRKIYLGLSELGEQGYEQRGPLLQAIQRVLRRLPTETEAADV